MIKNSRLVFSMSLEQRIKLITSAELFKSRSMEEYGFPAMEFLINPLHNRQVRATDFPSDLTLACAFDEAIIERTYNYIGNEAKAGAPFAYYGVNNLPDPDGDIAEPFILGKTAAGKVAGLKSAGALVNYNDTLLPDCTAGQFIDRKLITDAVMKNVQPDSAVIADTDGIERYKEYNFDGLVFGIARNKEEVARYLNEGCSFAFLENDFTEELVPYLVNLTEEYKRAYGAKTRGKITPEKIKMCRGELAMLPEERINEACGEVIEKLVALSGNDKSAVFERAVPLGSEPALFNEPLHDEGALEAARQSAVLIKNDGVLPFGYEKLVAVLGEYAKDEAYHGTGNSQTAPYLPFEVINGYDIQTVGFAYGYRAGQRSSSEQWETAYNLCTKADVTLVYLCARSREHVLPAEQLKLLEELSKSNIKTVAIVACDGKIDMSFAAMCNAVILTHRGGQKTASAVFEIITGYTVPSGKLPYPVYSRVEADGTESGELLLPLGYGLSYTGFEYKNLSINEGGISLTVTNVGERDGYASVLMYVQRKQAGEKDGGERRLRGFKKIFVRRHATEKITIPFGEETFRTYDGAKGLYCVEGGNYIITVGERENDVCLSGEITLRPYIYNENTFSSQEKKRSRNGKRAMPEFADTEDKRAFYARKHTAPIAVRIILAILTALYFDVAFVLMYLGGLFPDHIITYISMGAALGVINIAAVIFCIIAAKRHRALVRQNVPVVEETVAQLKSFKELAVISYEKPVTPEEIEEEQVKAEEQQAAEEAEELDDDMPVYEYDTTFTEGVSRKIAFRSGVSFQEICSNFHDYALSFGVEVAPSSVRALFAAIASGKAVFLRINHRDILPEFLRALDGYFQCDDIVQASDGWQAPSDLYWSLDGDRYVASGFVNAVYDAQRTPDKNAVAIIDNVKPESVSGWFSDFIRFALYPSERHIIKLNDVTQVEIPHNLCTLLITDGDVGELPKNIASACLSVHVGLSSAQAGEEVEVKPVSFNSFNDLVRDCKEENFLPESYWKKLDEMVEIINATERFGIGNKSLLQIEKFTSVLLACGADNGEAFTKMFTAKIVPLLKTLGMYKEDKGDKAVYAIIEKLYGDENLTKIRKALNKPVPAEPTGGD